MGLLSHVRGGQSKKTKWTYGTALNHLCATLAETAPPYRLPPERILSYCSVYCKRVTFIGR